MKKSLFVLAAVLISQLAFSANLTIPKSQLDPRLQTLIKKSLEITSRESVLKEISAEIKNIIVDNGITDQEITSSYLVSSRVDQMIYDTYLCVVKSHYSDSYDHNEKNWGVYTIVSQVCKLQQ